MANRAQAGAPETTRASARPSAGFAGRGARLRRGGRPATAATQARPTPSAPSAPPAPLSAALLTVAMLLFWKATRLYSFPIEVAESSGLAASYAGTEALKVAFAVAELVAIGALALSPRVRRAFAAPAAAALCGLACSASCVGALAAFDPQAAPGATLLLCDALAGALSATLAVGAVARVARLRPTQAVVVLLASFCLFELASFACNGMGMSTALTVALPTLSAACLSVETLLRRDGDASAGRREGREGGRQPERDGEQLARARELPWKQVLPCALLACFGSIAISAYFGVRIGPIGDGDPWALVASIALAGVVGACALPALRRGDPRVAETLPTLVLTILLCLAFFAIGADGSLRVLAPSLDHAFMLALWVAVACSAQRRHLPALTCACVVAALVVALQYFAASDFVFNVGWLHRLAQASSPATLLSVGALVLVMGACTVAAVRVARRPRADDAVADELASVLERAFRDTDLSDRERQIAAMLYRGLSVSRIADEVSLSPATVKSHSTHIYRKLGVHSKQELIRLVDEFREG